MQSRELYGVEGFFPLWRRESAANRFWPLIDVLACGGLVAMGAAVGGAVGDGSVWACGSMTVVKGSGGGCGVEGGGGWWLGRGGWLGA
ncbi:hypothetical protein Tco_0066673 [Tanacetum coccineum]